jgi:hypothetical protein
MVLLKTVECIPSKKVEEGWYGHKSKSYYTIWRSQYKSVRSQYKRLLSAHYYANGSGEKIKQWKTLQLTVILLGRSTDSTIIY